MKERYWLFKRGRTYYLQDSQTGKQISLRTRDSKVAEEAQRVRNTPSLTAEAHLLIAQAHLQCADPAIAERTWQMVMDQIASHGKPSTQRRVQRQMRSKPFDLIRPKKLVETTSDDLLKVLTAGGTATNHYLRCLQNLAVGLGWLITGDTGSGKTSSGINQLAHQVFQNEPRWGGLCIDEKGVYWETLSAMTRHYGRACDLIHLQINDS